MRSSIHNIHHAFRAGAAMAVLGAATNAGAQGIRLPFERLQAIDPGYEWSFLPYLYGEVVTKRNAAIDG